MGGDSLAQLLVFRAQPFDLGLKAFGCRGGGRGFGLRGCGGEPCAYPWVQGAGSCLSPARLRLQHPPRPLSSTTCARPAGPGSLQDAHTGGFLLNPARASSQPATSSCIGLPGKREVPGPGAGDRAVTRTRIRGGTDVYGAMTSTTKPPPFRSPSDEVRVRSTALRGNPSAW